MLTQDKLPFINVYRNMFSIIFPDKTAVESEFGINSDDFYLVVKLDKIDDGLSFEYNGYIESGIPTTKEEGLNQIDLNIPLPNGVYQLVGIGIIVGGVSKGSIGDLIYKQNMLFNVPSINQYDINTLIPLQ